MYSSHPTAHTAACLCLASPHGLLPPLLFSPALYLNSSHLSVPLFPLSLLPHSQVQLPNSLLSGLLGLPAIGPLLRLGLFLEHSMAFLLPWLPTSHPF